MKLIVGILVVASLLVASDKKCVCYASGYAYSYKTDKFYYSDVLESKRFKRNGSCLQQSTYAKNEWHDFFKSEVSKSYKYTVDVIHSCSLSKNSSETRKKVLKRARDKKTNFRNKNFSIRYLWNMQF